MTSWPPSSRHRWPQLVARAVRALCARTPSETAAASALTRFAPKAPRAGAAAGARADPAARLEAPFEPVEARALPLSPSLSCFAHAYDPPPACSSAWVRAPALAGDGGAHALPVCDAGAAGGDTGGGPEGGGPLASEPRDGPAHTRTRTYTYTYSSTHMTLALTPCSTFCLRPRFPGPPCGVCAVGRRAPLRRLTRSASASGSPSPSSFSSSATRPAPPQAANLGPRPRPRAMTQAQAESPLASSWPS